MLKEIFYDLESVFLCFENYKIFLYKSFKFFNVKILM